MKLSHGDSVIVIAGRDKGKKGTIMRVLADQNRVVVSGVNMVTKHVKKTAQSEGKKVKFEVSMSASNVAIVDPKTGKPTRVGYKIEGGKKVRIAKKSGTVLTRVKVSADAKKTAEAAPAAKKTPFWKKGASGIDPAKGEMPAAADAPTASTPMITRSAGRGS